MVSGGWKSGDAGELPAWILAPLLRRGYTIFAIYHVSQPEATVMEIIEDVHRGIRFVRHHAEEYEIDPNRIGVSGGSSGGHLSLMLTTRGGPGPDDAEDPVDRESSAVQAVAIFYPVTDLLNLGKSTENPGSMYLRPGNRFANPERLYKSGLDISLVEGAIVVDDVEAGSPAGEAGFRKGDVIVTVQQQPAKKYRLSEIRHLLSDDEGTIVHFDIVRDDTELSIFLEVTSVV
jgi:BD-FAE/PDZ domain